MRSKITINIDSELLDFIKKDYSDKEIDSLVQDALAKFLGVKQVWVEVDSYEPLTTPIQKTLQPEKKLKIKKKRRPKRILKIWEKIEPDLNNEFTIDEYWDTVQRNGFAYKKSARTSTILEHLRLLGEAGKIVKIGEKPMRYKKLGEEIRKDEDVQKSEQTQVTDDIPILIQE